VITIATNLVLYAKWNALAPGAPVIISVTGTKTQLNTGRYRGGYRVTIDEVLDSVSYSFYMSTNGGVSYSELLQGTQSGTSFSFTGYGQTGVTWYFKAKAVNSGGESGYSNVFPLTWN
jgi:hypothetical protein